MPNLDDNDVSISINDVISFVISYYCTMRFTTFRRSLLSCVSLDDLFRVTVDNYLNTNKQNSQGKEKGVENLVRMRKSDGNMGHSSHTIKMQKGRQNVRDGGNYENKT